MAVASERRATAYAKPHSSWALVAIIVAAHVVLVVALPCSAGPLRPPKSRQAIAVALVSPAAAPSPPEPVPAPVVPVPIAAIAAAPAIAALAPPRYDATCLDNPAPVYPSAARRLREEGRVLLRVRVTADGRAGDVDVGTSSGSERLDRAALDAFRRWRFVPARRGDEAVAADAIVPIVFSLDRA